MRLGALDGVEGAIEDLHRSIEALAAARERRARGRRTACGGRSGDCSASWLEARIRDAIDGDETDRFEALTARLEELEVGAVRARTDGELAAAAWRSEVGSLAARIDELLGLRYADAQAARAASEHLGERLEALSAPRPNDAGVTPTSETGPELRAELERLASSVQQLERRLDAQVAIGEEQVRATERSVRTGLASLGKQLIDHEAKGAPGGKGLGRSIERLGAAVVDADARLIDEDPARAAEGYVAFAPTSTGYRLLEILGPPPELGATVEVEDCEGPLVVTRFGARRFRSTDGRARTSTASESRQDQAPRTPPGPCL